LVPHRSIHDLAAAQAVRRLQGSGERPVRLAVSRAIAEFYRQTRRQNPMSGWLWQSVLPKSIVAYRFNYLFNCKWFELREPPMNWLVYVCLVVATAVSGYAQTPKEPPKYPAQLTIAVVTDAGDPVQKVTVAASTFDHWVPGEGFEKDINATRRATTDEDGKAVIEMPSIDGRFGIGVVETKGYYRDRGIWDYRFKEVKEGKWQPWNPTIKIVFKPILNPIPMYAKKLGELPYALDVPKVGEPVGFDLMNGDWVAPYGTGATSDLIFTFREEIPYKAMDKPFAATLKVSFSNPLDGIQSAPAPLNEGSALRLPRFAPEEGYASELVKRTERPAQDKPINPGIREDQNYFVRVRTVLDDKGKIKSAHYGKITGDIKFWANRGMQFIYCLNPTSLHRNVEFDPKRNLFTHLPSSQRVFDP